MQARGWSSGSMTPAWAQGKPKACALTARASSISPTPNRRSRGGCKVAVHCGIVRPVLNPRARPRNVSETVQQPNASDNPSVLIVPSEVIVWQRHTSPPKDRFIQLIWKWFRIDHSSSTCRSRTKMAPGWDIVLSQQYCFQATAVPGQGLGRFKRTDKPDTSQQVDRSRNYPCRVISPAGSCIIDEMGFIFQRKKIVLTKLHFVAIVHLVDKKVCEP